MKKIFTLLCILPLSVLVWSQKNTSYHIGYYQNVTPSGGNIQVQGIGGGIATTPWVNVESNRVKSGFKYNLVYSPVTFSEALFVSKGYYGNFVELKWDIGANIDVISSFKVYRKKYLSSEDSVLVSTVPATDRSWQDEYAEAGTIYQYYVHAMGVLDGIMVPYINYIKGIGFRLPTATVSGRITYDGGTSVPGVKVIAETEDEFLGNSIYLPGLNSYIGLSGNSENYQYNFDTAFTFQAWIKPETGDSSCIFSKGNQYRVLYKEGEITFYVENTPVSVAYNHKTDTFFHIAATYANNKARLFVLYNDREYWSAEIDIIEPPAASQEIIRIGANSSGNYFKGHIDELRLYNMSINEEFVLNNFGRYISGTEKNLVTYMRLNEGKGTLVFDLSRKGYQFNENHGQIINGSWSGETPLRDQLSYRGLTDESGNYLISGLPYGTDGTVYNIVPVLNSHEFNPSQNVLFVSSSSTTHNNINFNDVSSFRVTGNIVYKDTYFPVQGANFYVDGVILTENDGTPITSDGFGNYEIDVPIGYHYIEVRKYGHGFIDEGRFPAEPFSKHNFQQPINGLNFTDTTLIKVTGRVTGGPVQAAKPTGLGQTINNIGNATITLTTQKGHDLTQTGTSGTWNNIYYQNAKDTLAGVTQYNIEALNPRNLTLSPDTETGEFTAWLLPEKYTVSEITAGDYTFDDSYHVTIDLTSKFMFQTEIDSFVTDQAIDENGDTLLIYRIDSVRYNHNQDFIYRVSPSIEVTRRNGDSVFWETEVRAENGLIIPVVDENGVPKTPFPIFKQRNQYQLIVSVFERYVNRDNGDLQDIVPVQDGQIEVQNNLAIQKDRVVYDINDKGEVYYTFTGGLPNITTGGVGDYVKSFNIVAKTGQNGSISTSWLPNGGEVFLGYVFGGMPTGNNFVTRGPDDVKMILRDPPGSNSYAYLESGSEVSSTSTISVSNSITDQSNLNIDLGTKIVTFAGLGAGVITENEQFNEVDIGVETSVSFLDNNTITETFSTTQRWQTSNDPNYVGAMGDLFIGNSTNIVYGISTQITLLPENMGSGHVGAAFSHDTVNYDIGIRKSIRVSPEFNTGFIYTQYFIESQLIPNLKMLRNQIILNNPDVYQCVQCDANADDFGEPNTTGAYVANGYSGGDSYNIIIPAEWPADEIYEDSVAYYNEQIREWEKWLEFNEKEKVESALDRNISFDAGSVYENSVTYESSEENTHEYEFSISPYVSNEVGFEVLGCGSKFKYSRTINHTSTNSSGYSETVSTTYGFVLEDGDAADYLSVDLRKPGAQHGPVFLTKGGQTMCPYEGGEYTDYYLPGTPLSEATMQREVPVISAENTIQVNIPEDASAVYNIQLSNAAQTGDNQWFIIQVDEQSNQSGAMVKMDGAPILNGRAIMVPNGQTLNKTITIDKVQPDVYDYEDIGIILRSTCQFSAGVDLYADISDTVKLSAYFQRVCSGITLNSPNNQWVINTNGDTTLSVVLGDYNLSHGTLNRILFQYKAVSTPTWTTGMVYYLNEDEFNAASDPKELIDDRPELIYTFNMKDLQDREYDIKAKTICADGTVNESVIASGIKDVKRPRLFGTPQPGDGILNPGEDIIITFDEPIQQGVLTPYNFSVKGVLNGTSLQHEAGLYFDGTDDYASVQKGPDLNNKSFTITFWAKRGDLSEAVLFSQDDLEIGFAANNKIYCKAGSQEITSQSIFANTTDWYHIALSFNAETNKLALYVNDIIEVEDIDLTNEYNVNGKIYLGCNDEKTVHFNGYMHELRIWEKALSFGKVYATMYQNLRGDEIGLISYWPMNEASGNLARELARSNHASLFGADWAVFPTGFAGEFDGFDDVMEIPTSNSVLISHEMDFTLEFYFKATPQSNTVIFSNGNDNGTDIMPGIENIWVIGFNHNGELYAKNNNVSITLPDREFGDNTWHHFALVVNRLTNASIYIDGQLEQYSAADVFGGFMGVNMAIGARRNQQTSNIDDVFYDNYFNGFIDEFRIWKLARTNKQILLDMNSKLNGDEMGLLAYYPFEEFDFVGTLEESFKEYTDTLYATGTNTFTNIDVPKIKGSRPVQDVAFDWVVNEDQIIININEQPATVEKCVLEFTVDRVEDLHENRMASPITWTAYVKQNTVVWETDKLSLSKQLYESKSFNVVIRNNGGTDQGYTISNLPSWLECSETTGTLAPDSYKDITFEINEALYIGDYNVSLYLTSDFGYNEKFDLEVSVKKEEPDWQFNPSDFQYSCNIIAQLLIDSIISVDEGDMIAAFADGRCQGVAHLEYIKEYDTYLAFLDVYSNSEYGEIIEYKVWDASLGQVISKVSPHLVFEANTVIGHPWAPHKLHALSYFEGEITLNKGWNWVSFNLESPELNNLPALFKDVDIADNTLIKGQEGYDIYSEQLDGWFGSLTSVNGINTKSMFMLNIEQADTIVYEGPKADPTARIDIVAGWNWIGYTPQVSMQVEEAFASFEPTKGDIVKNQTQFAMYDPNLGWIGSLNSMQPGVGYMYKAENDGALYYPEYSQLNLKSARVGTQTKSGITMPWSANTHDYSGNLSMVAQLTSDEGVISSDLILGAFVNNECRGIIQSVNMAGNYYFLTISGETDGDSVEFKAFDPKTEFVYLGTEGISFKKDMVLGNLDTPFEIKLDMDATSINSPLSNNIIIYPNPTQDGITIETSRNFDFYEKISVHNILGHEVYRFTKSDVTDDGILYWDFSPESGNRVPSGIYLIQFKSSDGILNKSVIKK